MSAIDEDDYILARGSRAITRLYLQHFLWNFSLGYLLHPDIPVTDGIRIADIGAGTASWLLELSQKVPSTVQLDGFDISPAMFPPKACLAANVSLASLDVFAEVPQHLVGKYDVIHIRCFACIVKNNDPGPLLENLIRMLKPGGHLQWDEYHNSTVTAHDTSVSRAATDELSGRFRDFRLKSGFNWDWVQTLDTVFAEHGLAVVDTRRLHIPTALLRASTDNSMVIGEELLPHCEAMGLNRSEYRELLQRVTSETQGGVFISNDMTVVVGRREK